LVIGTLGICSDILSEQSLKFSTENDSRGREKSEGDRTMDGWLRIRVWITDSDYEF
jgi:hypothetical protein